MRLSSFAACALALTGVVGALAFGCADVGTSMLLGAGGASAGNGTAVAATGAGGANTGSSGGGAATSGTTTSGVTTSGATSGATTSASSTSGSTGSASATTTTSSGAGGAGTTSSSGGMGGVSGAGGGVYSTPPTCSSMTMYAGGNDANMKPGSACATCHVLLGAATGHTFDVAGTVYLTAHEPDDCNGVNVTGAVVVITDANGTDTPLPVNAVGNFYHDDLLGFAAFKAPLKARVEYNGNTRKMIGSITSGDCDTCHTETGAMSAPGRIMLP